MRDIREPLLCRRIVHRVELCRGFLICAVLHQPVRSTHGCVIRGLLAASTIAENGILRLYPIHDIWIRRSMCRHSIAERFACGLEGIPGAVGEKIIALT